MKLRKVAACDCPNPVTNPMYDYRHGSNVLADWSSTRFSRCSTRGVWCSWPEEPTFAGDARGLRYRCPLSHVSRVRGIDRRSCDRTYRKRSASGDCGMVLLRWYSAVFGKSVRAGAYQSRNTGSHHTCWRSAFSNRLGMPRTIRRGQIARVLMILFCSSLWFQSSTKRYGITRRLRRWDAVLPTPARFSPHHIGGSRCKVQRQGLCAPTFFRWITSQTHTTSSAERYSNDDFKLRNVAVPTELRSRHVLCDQRVRES